MKHIFKPLQIKSLYLENRLVVSAMLSKLANEDGAVTEEMISYYEEKAKGGWGLIITEDYSIDRFGGAVKRLPGLWSDDQIQGNRELTRRVHEAGGKLVCQLYHAGQKRDEQTGYPAIGATAIKDPTSPVIPHAMTAAEIEAMAERFGECAARAKKAGFDGVEVHGGHGYLLHMFLSPFTNKRADIYGGTIERRARFAVDVVKNIRKQVGDEYPIFFRISADEYTEGGLVLEDAMVIASLLEDAGVDCINCSQGGTFSGNTTIPPAVVPHACNMNNVSAIKNAVSIPVIAVGRINDPLTAESIVRSGRADLVAMSRASLADPELPRKALEERGDEINRCIGCMQGCRGEWDRTHLRCLVNPRVGMESKYEMKPAAISKNIYIAGGGVAGCETAIIAAQRGHKVTLFEKSGECGGLWHAASTPIGKAEYAAFLVWQQSEMNKYGVRVMLNQPLTREIIERDKPDIVVAATGGYPIIPNIKGIEKCDAVTVQEVLSGLKETGHRVAVIGGGLTGIETAEFLAFYGAHVSVFEMLPEIAPEAEEVPMFYLKERMKNEMIDIYTSARVTEFLENSICYEINGEKRILQGIDTVVLAAGFYSNRELEEKLAGVHCEVYSVGNCSTVKDGFQNIQEAYELGLKL